jgi:leucyl aminopeptidase (aminopeptidase T)
MPLYMDVHKKVPGLTAEAVAAAHAADLKVQKKHGVEYQKYWFDEASGRVYCLVRAPSKEAATKVHKEAHGLLADEITEVREGK